MSELRIENVSYRYKGADRLALHDASCMFRPGEVTAVVGPSGSGKTTLLSILAGLDRPAAGRVLLDGEDLSGMDLDNYRRQKASVIFQAFQLFPLQTVLENVCYPMELNSVSRKSAEERAKALLARMGIGEEKFKRYPANLSGGEQQRVAIARSLASGAGILLADEPTGNLDGENSRNVIQILSKLAHEEKYCVIIVTHDLEIAAVSDVVYQVVDGCISSRA